MTTDIRCPAVLLCDETVMNDLLGIYEKEILIFTNLTGFILVLQTPKAKTDRISILSVHMCVQVCVWVVCF